MALEKYIGTTWMNSAGTPLNAESLNHIEEGIENVTDALNELEGNIATKVATKTDLQQEVTTLNTTVEDKFNELNNKISALDVLDPEQSHQFVTAVSQKDGKITVTRRDLESDDLPDNIPQNKILSLEKNFGEINTSITGLQNDLSETKTNFETHSTTSATRFSKLDEIIGVDSTSHELVESSLNDRLISVEDVSSTVENLSTAVNTLQTDFEQLKIDKIPTASTIENIVTKVVISFSPRPPDTLSAALFSFSSSSSS